MAGQSVPMASSAVRFEQELLWTNGTGQSTLRPITAPEFQWVYDYSFNGDQVMVTRNGFDFTLIPNPTEPWNPYGVRMSSQEAYVAGKFCFKPRSPVNSGIILALYTRSFDKEPNDCSAGDRWDEMDYEWLGYRPGSVFLNGFSKVVQDSYGCADRGFHAPLPPLTNHHLFCMQWDTRSTDTAYPNSALWFMYDEASGEYTTLRSETGVMTQPMKIKMALCKRHFL